MDMPHVLLLDDGELDDVATLLEELEVPYERLLGGQIESEIPPPSGLLVATPRRAQAVRRGSPPGAKPGRPVRIIAVEEDSNAMRRMLREMGFHLLVRRPIHPETWKLLIRRAVYQGDERRLDDRITAGSAVSLSSDELDAGAVLADISNRGCRMVVKRELAPGTGLSITIPDREGGDQPLVLSGSVYRISRDCLPEGSSDEHTVVMIFDEGMPSPIQIRLARLLNRWSSGPDSFASHHEDPWMLPPRGNQQHGLTLDDETDPAIIADVDVSMSVGSPEERRHSPRGAFSGEVRAFSEEESSSRILLGRDLSAGGMRVERLPNLHLGDRFCLALYGPSQAEPFRVTAVVVRDDGEEGLGLRFDDVSASMAAELEKMVACLPDVESLESGETAGLGSVISEIVRDTE